MIANAEVMNAFLVFERLDGDKLEVPASWHSPIRRLHTSRDRVCLCLLALASHGAAIDYPPTTLQEVFCVALVGQAIEVCAHSDFEFLMSEYECMLDCHGYTACSRLHFTHPSPPHK